jgi:hypothetical protein
MGKRYKEFLIDILVKAYQIVLAVMIITPIATKKLDFPLFFVGLLLTAVLIVWGGAISARLEEKTDE